MSCSFILPVEINILSSPGIFPSTRIWDKKDDNVLFFCPKSVVLEGKFPWRWMSYG